MATQDLGDFPEATTIGVYPQNWPCSLRTIIGIGGTLCDLPHPPPWRYPPRFESAVPRAHVGLFVR